MRSGPVLEVIRNNILDDELPGEFGLIVSNPPYITDSEMNGLDDVVKDYEPDLALRGGTDGLDFYESIFAKSFEALIPGGAVFAEHGYLQGESVRKICRDAGFETVGTVKDYGNNERVTWGIKHAG